jgi:hypothetical protein
MPAVTLKLNQKALQQMVDPVWRRDIPYVLEQSIKKTIIKSRQVQQEAMDKQIHKGPVGLTRRGIRYTLPRKDNLQAFLYFTDKTSEYMRLIIDGGREKAKKKKLNIPVLGSEAKLRLTKHGNIPNSYIEKKAGDPKFFFGIPKGKTGEKYRGVWRRYGKSGYSARGKAKGKVRMVISWQIGERNQRKTYPAYEIFRKHGPKYLRRQLPIQFRAALKKSIAKASRATGF